MSMLPKEGLGARVRHLREEKGWSQNELASRLPNVKQQSIDQLEQGKVVRPRFLPELADVLETNVPWLLTGEGVQQAARPVRVETEIDSGLLRDVFVAVENTLRAKEMNLEAEHKALLVSTLYELVRSDEHRTVEKLKSMAENLVKYDLYSGRVKSE